MLHALVLSCTHLVADLGSAERRTRRRLAAVAADPRQATNEDVELLVRAHGVPETKVWSVVDRLGRGRIDATLAWCWTLQHDGGALAELCESAISDREVVAHMAIGPSDALLSPWRRAV